MRYLYVGIDIHKRTHYASFINCFFEKLGEVQFQNKKPDFQKLISEAKKYLQEGQEILFGLEDVSGNGRELAVFLLEKSFKVKYVNPSLSQSERKSAATFQKSDSLDSMCVARILLSKLDTLPDAEPNDLYWAITELVTKRRALVKTCGMLKNQLHTYLGHHYPSYKQFFSVFECKTSLAFWEKYPSPSKLKTATIEEFTAFLRNESHNFYTRKKAEQILTHVEKDGDTTNDFQDLRDFIVTTSVRQLKENFKLIAEIEEELKQIIPKFGYKLESMKGINSVTAAGLISEIGDINRFPSPDKLAAYAGISPMQYSSGQTDKNFSNKRGNRNLHQMLFFMAVSISNDPANRGKPVNQYFYNYYRKKISEGKTKKQSIKCVMRKLVNIIYKMMRDKTEYREPQQKIS
jgi:transposase